MSLIQEALKRQHEDLGGTGQPPAAKDKPPNLKFKTSDAPGQPEDQPAGTDSVASPPGTISGATSVAHPTGNVSRTVAQLPQIPVAEPSRSRTPFVIVGIVVIAILILVGGGWLATTVLMKFLSRKAAAVGAIVAMPGESNAAPVPVASIVPVTSPVTPPVVQTAVSTGTSAQVPTASSPVAPVATSKPPAAVEIKIQPAVWPPLKVNMLLKTSKTAVVRINNSELSVGDEIDGVLIAAIDVDAVTLKYKGEIRRLRAGEFTK